MSEVLSAWHPLHLALLACVLAIASLLLGWYLLSRNSSYDDNHSKNREVKNSR